MRLTVDSVLEHAHGVSFKTGPPGRVGVETEWLVVDAGTPTAPVPIDRLREIVAAAGDPPGGARISYEPGGQIELSSLPHRGIAACHAAMSTDVAYLTGALRGAGLTLLGAGVDPYRPPVRQLDTGRYACMAAYFASRGEPGDIMMCSTASVQVCVDVGADAADAATRWRLATALGPLLVAAFANSPLRQGRPTGWRSTRQAVWAALDPGRTAAPGSARAGSGVAGARVADARPAAGSGRPMGEPADEWAWYALDAELLAMRPRDAGDGTGNGWVGRPGLTFRQWLADGGRHGPTPDDLDFHLSTLFPPVRPRGWFELRMIDAVPAAYWPVPLAVVTALLDDLAAARTAAAATEPVAGAWRAAARDALTDPALATAARTCFAAALRALPGLGAPAELIGLVARYAERYVARGRCPADDLIDAFDHGLPAPRPAEAEPTWNDRWYPETSTSRR